MGSGRASPQSMTAEAPEDAAASIDSLARLNVLLCFDIKEPNCSLVGSQPSEYGISLVGFRTENYCSLDCVDGACVQHLLDRRPIFDLRASPLLDARVRRRRWLTRRDRRVSPASTTPPEAASDSRAPP